MTTAVSPDDRTIVAGSWDNAVYLWDRATLEQRGRLEGHGAVVWGVDFAPSPSSLIATSADDGEVRLWDAESGDFLIKFDLFGGDSALSVEFDPDPSRPRLLAAGGDGSAAIVDLTYYDRHIAGNAAFQIDRLRAELGDAMREGEVRAWAEAIRAGGDADVEDPVHRDASR